MVTRRISSGVEVTLIEKLLSREGNPLSFLFESTETSKVVDEFGEPLTVYHGTNAEFDEFTIAGTKTDDGMYGHGYYFTDEYSSGKYGKYKISANLVIDNPLILNDSAQSWMREINGIPEAKDLEDLREIEKLPNYKKHYSAKEITREIINQGYDGVIVYPSNHAETEYVVFDNKQIKIIDK